MDMKNLVVSVLFKFHELLRNFWFLTYQVYHLCARYNIPIPENFCNVLSPMSKGKQRHRAESNVEHTIAWLPSVKTVKMGARSEAAGCSLETDTSCPP